MSPIRETGDFGGDDPTVDEESIHEESAEDVADAFLGVAEYDPRPRKSECLVEEDVGSSPDETQVFHGVVEHVRP